MRPLAFAIVAALSTLLSTVTAARAETADAVPSISAIEVNGREIGDALIGLDHGDMWVSTAALQQANLVLSGARTMTLEGEAVVSLASLAPAVTYEFDLAGLALKMTAAPEAFAGRTVWSGGPAREPALRLRRTSAFFNYGATLASGARGVYATELGISTRGALWRSTLSKSSSGGFVRGATTMTYDDERRLLRWELGDTAANSDVPGATVPIAGLAISREFSIDPFFVQHAALTIGGATSVPGSAEVYVNGQLVQRVQVAPGRFELRDLPVQAGAGNVRVVIRDEFGRAREIASGYYRSPRVLRRGLHQFRYALGAPRTAAVMGLWGYGGIAGTAQHRFGVTDTLTIGGSAEFDRQALAGGLDFGVRLPAGELEASARTSRADGRSGSAGSATYLLRGRRLSAGATVRGLSASFSSLGVSPLRPRVRFDGQMFIDATIVGGVSAGARYVVARDWTGASPTRVALSTTFRLPRNLSLWSSLEHERRDGRAGVAAMATLGIALGGRSSGSLSHRAGRNESGRTTMAIQRSLPLGPGIGYRVQSQQGQTSALMSSLQLQTGAGRVELRNDVTPAGAVSSVNVAGSIVAIDGGIHMARPVGDAFALVRVAGVPGVATYASNQYVGRTNRRGEIVVPSLASYYHNRIVLDDGDLPMSHYLPQTKYVLSPGLRGGSVLSVPVHAANLVSGRFLVPSASGAVEPAHADAEAAWGTATERVPLGPAGEFFFEQAVAGTHAVRVAYRGEPYRCRLDVPPPSATTIVQSLGTVSCAAESATIGGGQ